MKTGYTIDSYTPRQPWSQTKCAAYVAGAAQAMQDKANGTPLRGRRLITLAALRAWYPYAESLGWSNPGGDEQRAAYLSAFSLGYKRGFKRNAVAETALYLCEGR